MEDTKEVMNQEKKYFQMITSDDSYHEGLNNVGEYIKKAAELGIAALAIVDKNSMAMHVQFQKKCESSGIKPILGATLTLDFPDVDYSQNIRKRKNEFEFLTKIEILRENGEFENVFKSLNGNPYKIFSIEENFQKLISFQKTCESFKKSSSASKKANFASEFFNFMQSIGFAESELLNAGLYHPIQTNIINSKSNGKKFEELLLSSVKSYLKTVVDSDSPSYKKIDRLKYSNGFNLEESFGQLKNYQNIKETVDYYSNQQNSGYDSNINLEKLINYDDLAENFININSSIEYGDIVILAINDEGYLNLKKLISKAFLDGQTKIITDTQGKRKVDSYPLTKISDLADYKNGLLILSRTNKQDVVSRTILSGGNGLAVANRLKDYLGENYSLSVSKNYKYEQKQFIDYNKELITNFIEISDQAQIPCIATTDARFIDENSYDSFDLKSAMLLGEIKYELSRDKKVYSGQYLISESELENNFTNYKELLENNEYVAKNAKAKMKLNFAILPHFSVEKEFYIPIYKEYFEKNGLVFDESWEESKIIEILKAHLEPEYREKYNELWDVEAHKTISNIVSDRYMNDLAWKGLLENLKKDYPNDWESKIEHYKERYDYETQIINKMGFSSYFLIVYDFIRYAKENNIPVGIGRGSGAGSLVAYSLKITGIDPIPYNLFFERFLNPERVSMPDFDIDFSQGERELVINYVKEKYGNTTQIATHGTYKARSVMKAVAKALGHTITYEDDIVQIIPEDPSATLGGLYEDEEVLQLIESEIGLHDKLKLATTLEGKKQNSGVHAGGVVMAVGNMNDFSATQCSPDGGSLVCQLDKNDIETAGLVKFDFLGLKTLDIIKESQYQILNNKKINFDINSIPLNDEKTYELLRKGLTRSIFQLESDGMRDLVLKLQVKDIEEISALVALYRPGPMTSGMTSDYVENKSSGNIELMDESLSEVLSYTYGTMIYQEQVMQAAQIIAGYTLGEADQLRRAMGKKKIEEMTKNKSIFINRATELNNATLTKDSLNITGKENVQISLSKYNDLSSYINENGYFILVDNFAKFLEEIVYEDKLKMDFFLDAINNNVFRVKHFFNDYTKTDFKDDDEKNKFLSHSHIIKEYKSIIYQKFDTEKANDILMASYAFCKYTNIFQKIESFAGYGFNKSHSLSYGINSYQCSYLKANYPIEFFAAICTYNSDDLEKLSSINDDMKNNFNINLAYPSINKSDYNFKADDDKVRFGFCGLKGLGRTGKVIEEERRINGEYTSVTDLVLRIHYRNEINNEKTLHLSSSNFDSLLFSGCLDEFYIDFIKKSSQRRNVRGLLLNEFNMTKFISPKSTIELVEYRLQNGHYPKDKVFEGMRNLNPFINGMMYKASCSPNESLLFMERSKFDDKNNKDITKAKIAEYNASLKFYIDFCKKNSKVIKELGINSQYDFNNLSESIGNKDIYIQMFDFVKKHYPYEFNDIAETLDLIKAAKIKNYIGEEYWHYSYIFADKYESYEDKAKTIIKKIKENEEHYEKFTTTLTSEVSYDHHSLIAKEKEYSGIYITGHPTEINGINQLFQLERSDIKTLADIKSIYADKGRHCEFEKPLNILVSIDDINVAKIKSGQNIGKDYARLSVQDKTESMRIAIFNELYELVKDNLDVGGVIGVVVNCKVSDKGMLNLNVNAIKSYYPAQEKPEYIEAPRKNHKKRNRYD